MEMTKRETPAAGLWKSDDFAWRFKNVANMPWLHVASLEWLITREVRAFDPPVNTASPCERAGSMCPCRGGHSIGVWPASPKQSQLWCQHLTRNRVRCPEGRTLSTSFSLAREFWVRGFIFKRQSKTEYQKSCVGETRFEDLSKACYQGGEDAPCQAPGKD